MALLQLIATVHLDPRSGGAVCGQTGPDLSPASRPCYSLLLFVPAMLLLVTPGTDQNPARCPVLHAAQLRLARPVTTPGADGDVLVQPLVNFAYHLLLLLALW